MRPSRGLLAHAGAGGWALAGQRTLVVACWRTPEREVGRSSGQRALVVACLCTPGREVDRRARRRALVVACWRLPGREVGSQTGQRALVMACRRTRGPVVELDRAACPGRGLVLRRHKLPTL